MRPSAPPAGKLIRSQRIHGLLGLMFIALALSLALPVGVHATVGDGGWLQQDSGGSVWFTDVTFTDVQRGWAVSDSGGILATANGGRSWAALYEERPSGQGPAA